MKPYKNIKQLKDLIQELKTERGYSNNVVLSSKRINVLISVVNSFESVLTSNKNLDALQSLIYARYKCEIKPYILAEKPIPITYIQKQIQKDLEYESKFNFRELINDLILHDQNICDKKDLVVNFKEHYEEEINDIVSNHLETLEWKK